MQKPTQLAAAELPDVLATLLAALGGPRAGRGQVQSFLLYLRQPELAWEALRYGTRAAPQALLLTVLLPGRTAMLLMPHPGEHGIAIDAQRDLLTAALTQPRRPALHYAQVLLEPEAAAKRAVLEAADFKQLAPLAYLERDVVFPWVEPPAPDAAAWVSYSAATHARFAQTVLATYEHSLDCPELTGLRPIEDVLAAHRASGRFDARLWELAVVGERIAGCLLLAQHTHGALLEVVYMGVVPEFRRRGVGRLLLARALEHCRRVAARQLTIVVDQRNVPACTLYSNFGLRVVARRTAWFFRWT
jgi:ribosomal protein S18 acetylase RimI-like enzyme